MIAAVHDYEHAITCIDTDQVRPRMAACYLMRSGDRYAFIECGTALSLPILLGVLQARGIEPGQVDYVMPTHVHLDHAGGAGVLMRACPNATLVVHPRGARHLIDPGKLIEGAAAVYGAERIPELYGEIAPVPQSRVCIAEDGHRLDFNGRELVFLDAPGHARHHYAIWDAQSRGIFTGDVFGLSYRDLDGPKGPYLLPTTTPVQFEPEAWFATLERLMALDPEHVFLTHYGRVGELPRLVADLRRGLVAYVAIARDLRAAPDRHQAMVERLGAYSVAELRALGCTWPEGEIRSMLDLDMQLNAQGLEVWLDRVAA